ncbi:MAG: enoyl-ACP reductase [Gemmatimonadetes bacterium]|nr:enoyl-ACP reductase [Gemmatimonadota bacterium]
MSETTSEATVTEETNHLLKGRKGLIVGVANERSIAWGIARRAAEAGAQLAFTYQGETLERRVRPLAEKVTDVPLVEMDVTDEAQVDAAFDTVKQQFGKLDFLVHSVAWADRNDLTGRTIDTSREGFLKAMEISCYSFIQLARKAEPILSENASLVTLSYLGSVKAVPNYNVMGIAKAALEASVRYLAIDLGVNGVRVNAISAGPIKTLAASGVSGLRGMLADAADRAPLKRNVDTDDVGGAALYFLSSLSKGVTGEIHYVDAGFSTTAM